MISLASVRIRTKASKHSQTIKCWNFMVWLLPEYFLLSRYREKSIWTLFGLHLRSAWYIFSRSVAQALLFGQSPEADHTKATLGRSLCIEKNCSVDSISMVSLNSHYVLSLHAIRPVCRRAVATTLECLTCDIVESRLLYCILYRNRRYGYETQNSVGPLI